jgi:hypothetical protein
MVRPSTWSASAADGAASPASWLRRRTSGRFLRANADLDLAAYDSQTRSSRDLLQSCHRPPCHRGARETHLWQGWRVRRAIERAVHDLEERDQIV